MTIAQIISLLEATSLSDTPELLSTPLKVSVDLT